MACRAGGFQATQQRLSIAGGHDLAGLAEGADEAVEGLDDRVSVLGTDVGPDTGVAGRHPRHVPEAAGGQPEEGAVGVGRAGVGEGHERGRGQVGHVGHDGHEGVVAVGGMATTSAPRLETAERTVV